MQYVFGGIALDTPIEFFQLEDIGTRLPRLHIEVQLAGGVPPEGVMVDRSEGRYRLALELAEANWIFRSRLPGAFVFNADHRRILCHVPSLENRGWQDVLFRRVLPRIATVYGATTIHAAAIANGDRCFLVLGQSGAGKSTLTTFCAQADWRILSDDTAVLWVDDEITVEPVQRGMGIWDDARVGLNLPDADCTPMPGYDGRKWCFAPSHTPSPDGRKLSAILVLERSADVSSPQLTRLTSEETLRFLLAQNIPFTPQIMPSAKGAAAFGRIAALSRRCPGFRFTYPNGYDRLSTVEKALINFPIEESR